jgi:peptide/nickel transport system substrate-binding protein
MIVERSVRGRPFASRRVARRTFVRGSAAAGLATGVVTLAGCATPPNARTVAPTAAAAAPPAAAAATVAPTAPAVKLGGTFRAYSSSETPDLDPHLQGTSLHHVSGPGIVFSKLVQNRADVPPGSSIPTGDLAESWEQPDELTYIFKLRPNVKWQNIAPVNGRELVAADVKFSFERQIALKINASRLPQGARIEVIDPKTIKIVTAKPDADLLVGLAYYTNKIIPKETVDLKGDLKEGPLIGTGPWILEKWDKDKLTSLVKNPDYYAKGYPRVDRIEFNRIYDTATAMAAMRANALDAVSGTFLTRVEGEPLAKADPRIVLETYKDFRGMPIEGNMAKPPLNDPRIRQAVFKAIDKQAIVQGVFGGDGWFSIGVGLPSADFLLPEAEMAALYKQDLEGARRLLAQANATNLPELEISVLGVGTLNKDAAELVQADLRKLGITSVIKIAPSTGAWTAAYADGAFDLNLGTGGVSSLNSDLYQYYHSSSTRQGPKVQDPALDALIDKQAVMVKDPDGRKKIVQDIQRHILTNAYRFNLASAYSASLRWSYVKDYFYMLLREETFPRLWLDK